MPAPHEITLLKETLSPQPARSIEATFWGLVEPGSGDPASACLLLRKQPAWLCGPSCVVWGVWRVWCDVVPVAVHPASTRHARKKEEQILELEAKVQELEASRDDLAAQLAESSLLLADKTREVWVPRVVQVFLKIHAALDCWPSSWKVRALGRTLPEGRGLCQ